MYKILNSINNYLLLFIITLFILINITTICADNSHDNNDNDDDLYFVKLNQILTNLELTGLELDENANDAKLFVNILLAADAAKRDNQSCHECNETLRYFKSVANIADQIKQSSKSLCRAIKPFDSERVCLGTIERFVEPLIYALQLSKITVPEICATYLHPDCMTHYGLPLTHATNWELHIPALTVDPNSYYNNSENGGQLKMLHLTDTHMDLYYTPGASSVCGESTCCRPTSYGHNHSAGVWAETRYLCDVGLPFAEQAIRHMGAEHPDLDFVIWTGDNVPHDEFNSTQQQDLENNRLIASVVKSTFGQKRVFPCLGNHDTHPFNQYIPYEIDVKSSGQHSMSWLYKTLADDYWSQWINTAKAKESFKIGGYYSAMATDRIKVVILNNNICQHRNWWLAYDPVDPDGQLKWLIDELYAAELNKQTAIIIGHIPPYQTKVCYTAWASNYFRIMVRFQHLIVGQYYGHTHLDEIVVFYDKNRTTNQTYPISHGYIGSSVTTWPAVNPGYRIFTLDETGKPLDFTTYYSNITQDNIDGKQIVPKWQIAYTAKQSYQLSELSKEAWDAFITRADTDQKLTDLYFSHLHRFTDAYIENMRNRGQYNPKYIHNLLQSRKVLNPIYDLLPNHYS